MSDADYGDLLALRRPVHAGDLFSRRHPPMERLNRAKLFAPFAALSGFEEAVRAKEVPYVPRHALDPEEFRELNRTLNWLYQATRTSALARMNAVEARVEYFVVCADANSDAFGRLGQYHSVTGVVRRVDPQGQMLTVGARTIPFFDIALITDPFGRPLG